MFLVQPSVIHCAVFPAEHASRCVPKSHCFTPASDLDHHQPDRVAQNSMNSTRLDNDENAVAIMDAPGVKASDIKVQLTNGNLLEVTAIRNNNSGRTPRRYEKTYKINQRKYDTSNVRAELENGVLTISIPKRKMAEPIIVPVSSANPPADHLQQNERQLMTIDLPGVKPSDLGVKFYDGFVILQGQRAWGSKSERFLKKFEVDASKFEADKLCAYLVDGVLTVHAPVISGSVDAGKSSVRVVPLTIPFHSDTECVQPETAALDPIRTEPEETFPEILEPKQDHIEDKEVMEMSPEPKEDEFMVDQVSETNLKEDEIMVETVDENDEWISVPSK